MIAVSIGFRNSNEQPIYLQVDPWAGLYLLRRGEEIEVIAESNTEQPSFSVEEKGNSRILLIAHSSDYHVVVDGKRVHWSAYQTNL